MMYIATGKERCEMLATYMIENDLTVRAVAARFGISKSTVHKDITQNLRKINLPLYRRVKRILDKNKSERHLRGGEATRIKYMNIRHSDRKKDDKNDKDENIKR